MKTLSFQKIILNWFDKNGRKHLPWQQNKTPYRIWISEIMLQQTQVQTVIPYFERFMQEFPDLDALANATEDAVLHLWAGLGYYTRARMLHRAAKIIVTHYQNKFPNTLAELKQLPGIGPSTAGAILALAFNQQATILDGNVKRVLARLHGIREPIDAKEIEKKLWEIAVSYTPKKRVADYTQAMMDIGATLCTQKKPACPTCPLRKNCSAYQHNIAEQLPIKKATRALPVREATFLIVKNKQHILLYKRPPTGIWGSLWSLPEIAGQPNLKTMRTFCQQNLQLNFTQYDTLKSFRHTFTHYHLQVFPVLIAIKKLKTMEGHQQIWYNLDNPNAVGLPKPIKTILENIR